MKPHELPFWERDLSTFGDDVITRLRCTGRRCWYASLNDDGLPDNHYDFTTAAESPHMAVLLCAREIRHRFGAKHGSPLDRIALICLKSGWADTEERLIAIGTALARERGLI